MLDWSDVDIAVRDAVREFVDKEIRPHLDELESGDMEPYPIVRKLFATFGIDDDGQGIAGKTAGEAAQRRRRALRRARRNVRWQRVPGHGIRPDQRTVPGDLWAW